MSAKVKQDVDTDYRNTSIHFAPSTIDFTIFVNVDIPLIFDWTNISMDLEQHFRLMIETHNALCGLVYMG